MPSLSCKEVMARLVDFIESDVEPVLKTDIEQHLQNCPLCNGLKKSYEKTINLLKKSQQVEPDKEMIDRVWNYVSSHLSKPSH